LDFATDCGYLCEADHIRLTNEAKEIGAMLGVMLSNPNPFLLGKSDH
jgi:hypothetical protein